MHAHTSTNAAGNSTDGAIHCISWSGNHPNYWSVFIGSSHNTDYRRNFPIPIGLCNHHGNNTPLHQDTQEKDKQMFPHMGKVQAIRLQRIHTANKLYISIHWVTDYIHLRMYIYIEIAIIDTLITSDSYWVYNVAKWRLRVALEGT